MRLLTFGKGHHMHADIIEYVNKIIVQGWRNNIMVLIKLYTFGSTKIINRYNRDPV